MNGPDDRTIAEDLRSRDAARMAVALDALEARARLEDQWIPLLHDRTRDTDPRVQAQATRLVEREGIQRAVDREGATEPEDRVVIVGVLLAHRSPRARKKAAEVLGRSAPDLLPLLPKASAGPLARASSARVDRDLSPIAETLRLPLAPLAREVHRWAENGLVCLAMHSGPDELLREAHAVAHDATGTLWLARLGLTKLSSAIGELGDLRHLHLSENALTELPPEIGALGELVTLTLDSNQLRALPDALFELGALEWLKLSFNRFATIPDGLARLTHLRRLEIVGRAARWPRDLHGLEQLEEIWLTTNGLLPPCFGTLPNLRILKVLGRRLTLDASVGRLERLAHLDASYTQLDSVPEELGSLPLETLYLHGNPLSAIPESLLEQRSLRRLSLGQTNVEPATLARIRAAMPWCEIS